MEITSSRVNVATLQANKINQEILLWAKEFVVNLRQKKKVVEECRKLLKNRGLQM
jgi:hypothetical protein